MNINRGSVVPNQSEILVDNEILEQIKSIEKQFENVSRELIEKIFNDCGYDMQKTIETIRNQESLNSDWKVAKANNRKKNVPSPTSNKENFTTENHSEKTNDEMNSNDQITNVNVAIEPHSNSNSSKIDSVKFLKVPKKKVSSSSNNSKRRNHFPIPSEPVRIHRSVPPISGPVDVQFGDILWIDSKPSISSTDDQEKMQNDDQTTSFFIEKIENLTMKNENSLTELSTSIFEPSGHIPADFPDDEAIPTVQSPSVLTTQRPNLTSPNSNNNLLCQTNRFHEVPTQNNPPLVIHLNVPNNFSNNNVEFPPVQHQWNPTGNSSKTNSKQPMLPSANYQNLPLYSLNAQQSPPYYHSYQMIPSTHQMMPLIIPNEVWSTGQAFVPSYDSHPYGPTTLPHGYPNYPNYQSSKYNRTYYDGTYPNFYRTTEVDLNSHSQLNKETFKPSKLSVTAQPFYYGESNSTVYQNTHSNTRHLNSHNTNHSRNNLYNHEPSQLAHPNNSSNINRYLQQ